MSGKANKYVKELVAIDSAYKHHIVDKEKAIRDLTVKYDT